MPRGMRSNATQDANKMPHRGYVVHTCMPEGILGYSSPSGFQRPGGSNKMRTRDGGQINESPRVPGKIIRSGLCPAQFWNFNGDGTTCAGEIRNKLGTIEGNREFRNNKDSRQSTSARRGINHGSGNKLQLQCWCSGAEPSHRGRKGAVRCACSAAMKLTVNPYCRTGKKLSFHNKNVPVFCLGIGQNKGM